MSPLAFPNSLPCVEAKKVQDSIAPPGLGSALSSETLWVQFSFCTQTLSAGGLETVGSDTSPFGCSSSPSPADASAVVLHRAPRRGAFLVEVGLGW